MILRAHPRLAGFALLAAAMAGCGGPAPERRAPAPIRLQDAAAETGLAFTHDTGAQGRFLMPEIMGAGAALLDYDGDGDLDALLVQSQGGAHRLFRNELIPSGKLRFTDATADSGIAAGGYGMGAATGDFNKDGRVDLLITGFGANALYANLGGGKFQNVTAASSAVRKEGLWSSSASFFDYDRDGWPDLVILSYVDFTERTNQRCFAPAGEPDYCTPVVYRPVAARLFHNEGGRFIDVTSKAGLDKARGPGLGVIAADIDRDGWLDLLVANDTASNHLWINGRDGTFTERGLPAGFAFSEDGKAKAGMGIALGDYDSDGDEDAVVLNLMREGATLFLNGGKGEFTDISMASRLHALTLAFTGFGAGWADFDNDGRLDLLLANGAVMQRDEQRGQPRPFKERNLVLRNTGAGFEESGSPPEAEITRGAAFGDVDNDGRVDTLLANNGGPPRLLLNRTEGGRHLTVEVADGIGARVTVERAGAPALLRVVRTDGSYLSASSPLAHFGLGAAAAARVIVEWPDGARRERTDIGGTVHLKIGR